MTRGRKTTLAALALALTASPALAAPTSLQREASSVTPAPDSAKRDRGRLWADGCMVDQSQMRWPACLYGRRSSRTTVVLVGDSKAMHLFPALERIAERRGWRLIGRIRAGCTPASIDFSYKCDKWRRGTLRRIERRDRPDLVVVGSGAAYRAIAGGRRLGSRASEPVLTRGYARTLRRLRRTGAPVAVVKASPRAGFDVADCVARSMRRLRRCAFTRRAPARFDTRAARGVRGAKLIDPRDAFCLRRICPAVVDGVLVYRDEKHFTGAFGLALAPWLEERLPEPR